MKINLFALYQLKEDLKVDGIFDERNKKFPHPFKVIMFKMIVGTRKAKNLNLQANS